MKISVSDAKAQLAELVRRAEAGEEVVLTRHGQPTVKLVAVKPRQTPAERRAVIYEVRAASRGKALPGPCAARSQDFLYGDDGLPG